MDEYADILGHDSLPRRDSAGHSRLSGTFKFAFWLALILVVYVLGLRVYESYLRWAEQKYKLSQRRKHGIPDSDKRPFNVAYNAVVQARKDKEREAANKRFEQQLREQRAEQTLRHRQETASRQNSYLPGAFSAASPRPQPAYQPHSNRVAFADASVPSPDDIHLRQTKKNVGILKKRALDDEDLDDVDQAKKSRVEGDEHIDGDEEPEWQDGYTPPSRRSKRQLNGKPDFVVEKRLRKSSDSTLEDEDMEVDDEVAELETINRGKKRDRAEAGSSFGGDSDEEEEKPRQSKRRNKRNSVNGVDPRGRKRDRNADLSSEESDNEPEKKLRKKHGKKIQPLVDEDKSASDVSMDDASPIRGRKPGDEWESNGISYKLGPNGQRLQKVLIRESHKKYSMPQDSLHPDREGRIEVCVWSWLTEDEMKSAKARGLLSHQESLKPMEKPLQVQPEKSSPPKTGKHLLWDAVGPSLRSTQENPFTSSANKSPVKIKPNSDLASPRRLPPHLPLGLTDSTNSTLSPYRQYTKWEKQELEAKAMMKVREAARKKQEEKEKAEKEKAEKEKAAAPVIPTISLTKPSEESNLFKKPEKVDAPAFGSTDTSTKPETAKSPFTLPGTASKPTFPAAANTSQDKSEAKPGFSLPGQPASTSPAILFAPSQPAGTPVPNLFAPQKPAEKPSLQSAGFPSSFPQSTPVITGTPFGDPSKQASTFPSAQSSATPSTGPSTTAPKFSFNLNPKPSSDSSATAASGTSGPSLLSRLDNAAKPSEAKADPFNLQPTANGANATPASAAAATPAPKFNFFGQNPPSTPAAPSPSSLSGAVNSTSVPALTAPKPTFSFNPKPAEPSISAGASANAVPSSTAPKPTFSFNSKPAESSAPTVATTSTPFSFTAKPADALTATSLTAASSGAASSPFSFAAKPSESANATQASEGLKFKFTTPAMPSQSPLGSSTPPSNPFVFSQDTSKTITTPFGASTTPFGNKMDTPATPFGAGIKTDMAPATPFGAAAKPAETPASSPFSFGAKTDTSAAPNNPFTTSTSAFGGSTFKIGDSSNKAADGKEKSPFSSFGAGTTTPFGSAGTNAFQPPAQTPGSSTPAAEPPKSIFGATTTPQSSPFGGFGASKPTFGTSSAPSTTTTNIFAAPSNSSNQQPQ